jgi:hypothetical protein
MSGSTKRQSDRALPGALPRPVRPAARAVRRNRRPAWSLREHRNGGSSLLDAAHLLGDPAEPPEAAGARARDQASEGHTWQLHVNEGGAVFAGAAGCARAGHGHGTEEACVVIRCQSNPTSTAVYDLRALLSLGKLLYVFDLAQCAPHLPLSAPCSRTCSLAGRN